MAAAVAGAVTLGIGTVCVAAVGGAQMLGFASATDKVMQGVTEVQLIDRVVVVRSGTTVPDALPVLQLTAPADMPVAGPPPPGPAAPAAQAPATAAPAPAAAPAGPSPAPAAPSPSETPAPVTTTAKGTTTSAAPVTTAQPVVTTTTVKATTTTTRPPGVPRDWPADKPIPPMPPNCKDPQLEDNGVWNCDD